MIKYTNLIIILMRKRTVIIESRINIYSNFENNYIRLIKKKSNLPLI